MARACTIRPALKADAGDIARLYLISSDGLAAYIWSRYRQPGMSLEDVGRARYGRTKSESEFSYENCTLTEDVHSEAAVARSYLRDRRHRYRRQPLEPLESTSQKAKHDAQ